MIFIRLLGAILISVCYLLKWIISISVAAVVLIAATVIKIFKK